MSLPGIFVAKEQVMVCAFHDVRAVHIRQCGVAAFLVERDVCLEVRDLCRVVLVYRKHYQLIYKC